MKFVDMKQNTPEWLEFRKNHIGASDAPIIMGVSPWCTPSKLLERKLGLRDDSFQNDAMKRGHELEKVARLEYFLTTGIAVAPAVVKDDWRCASLDGIDDTHQHIVEIKCPGEKDHRKALDGEIPEKYYPQLQHQMLVTNLKSMHYFSFDGENGIVLTVERDMQYIYELCKKEQEFWELLQSKKQTQSQQNECVIREDISWETVAKQYLETAELLKIYENQEKNLRETLIALSGNCNTQGGGIKLSQVVRKGSIDYIAATSELKDLNLEKYRKPDTQYWKIGTI